MKHSFKNDYAEGAHPRILQALAESNFSQQPGYGLDAYSEQAAELIREKMAHPEAAVHFVSGGTQANLVVLSALLRPYESVVSAETGHIFTNESGAIEATGHKVHGLPTTDGKLRPQDIARLIAEHQNKPHQVQPKIVYISNATELGTIYSGAELKELYNYCQSAGLWLFMDGARVGHALMAETNDLTMKDLGRYTDVCYLGGTKNGALIGEAIVINKKELQPDFGFHLKQKGALLAKGRLLGIQFLELFKDDLYFELAGHANRQAMKIKMAFDEVGINFLAETFTNQIFPILSNHHIEKLSENFDFYIWKKLDDDMAAIRLITSWATTDAVVTDFIHHVKNLK